MTFLWLQMLLHRWTKESNLLQNHIAYWLTLIHYSMYSSSLQSELWITHANTPALSRIKNVIFHQICWNWATLPLQSSSLQPPKFDVDKQTPKKYIINFVFQILWKLVSNQLLQKICKGKVCPLKIFRTNLGKIGQNVLRTPKSFPAPTPMW